MMANWRWVGPAVLLASVLGAFMALDKTTLHWYVPESPRSTLSSDDLTPAARATTPAATQFTALESRAIAVQWVSLTWPAISGGSGLNRVDCQLPQLNEASLRYSTVCTRAEDGGEDLVVAVAVDAITGAATELLSAAPTKMPPNVATPTVTFRPR